MPQRKCVIGNGVWIGNNAIVKQGVNIGDGAIIGAGAVVTHNVLPYTIVGGVPARILTTQKSDEEINCIMDNPWWDWDDERIKKACEAEAFDSYEKYKRFVSVSITPDELEEGHAVQ